MMMKSTLTFAIALVYASTITSAYLDRDNHNQENKNLRAKLALDKIRNKSNANSVIQQHTGWRNHHIDARNDDDSHHLREVMIRNLLSEDQSALHSRIALLTDCAFTNSRKCRDPCQDVSAAVPPLSSSQNTTMTTLSSSSSTQEQQHMAQQDDEEITCGTFDFEANPVVSCCSVCTPLFHDLVVGLVSAAWDLDHCSWAQALEKATVPENPTVERNVNCDAEVIDLLAMPSLTLLVNTIECLDSSFRAAVDDDHSSPPPPNTIGDMISSAFVGACIAIGAVVALMVVGGIVRHCRTARTIQKVNHSEEVDTLPNDVASDGQ